MPTAAPTTDHVLSDLQKSIADLQARARTHVDTLDERIRALAAKQGALGKQIPREAFVAKIVADVRDTAAADGILATSRAKAAAHLHAHVPIRRLHAVNYSGVPDFITSGPRPLQILDHQTPALALVGMLPELFEPAIAAWAGKLADELGLPATGSIEKVGAEYARLQTEIEGLTAERETAKLQLSELVTVAGSPFIDQESFKRMRGELPPLSEPIQEDKNSRPVGVYDEDGRPQSAIGSDGWNEYWAKRRAADAADAQAEAAAPYALTGGNG
jgi:hypothetical protein